MKGSVARSIVGFVTLTMGLVIARSPAHSQEGFTLDREREIRLAMSAGPPSVSGSADVYLFRDRGFELEIEGSNGFACMVIRQAERPDVLAPHCFSPAAVASVLPAKLEEGRLIAAGRTLEEVEGELAKGFERGSLPLPSANAYAYMLSSGQRLGSAEGWKPHFMLYMPYATNADVAGDPSRPEYPFVGPIAGHPHSTLVIVMTEFVDPEDVPLPSRE